MVLVTSRLPEGSSNFLGWVCTLATKLGKKHKHWPSTHHTVGTEGTEGYYEHSTCVLCGQSVHVFVEAEALSDEQMRKRADEQRAAVQALMALLDGVEPDYAAGRGTKDGRIVDRTEPWDVPLEERYPNHDQE